MKNTLNLYITNNRTKKTTHFDFSTENISLIVERLYYLLAIFDTYDNKHFDAHVVFNDSMNDTHEFMIFVSLVKDNCLIVRLKNSNKTIEYFDLFDMCVSIANNIVQVENKISERSVKYYSNTNNAEMTHTFSEIEYADITREFNELTDKQKARFKVNTVSDYAKLLLTFNNL